MVRRMPRRRGRAANQQLARGVIVGVSLLAMLLVPLAALGEPKPARLGWQMYASVTPLPEIWLEREDGSRESRRFGEIASGIRPELDYSEPMARFLCARNPAVIRVHFLLEDPRREVAIPCPQS